MRASRRSLSLVALAGVALLAGRCLRLSFLQQSIASTGPVESAGLAPTRLDLGLLPTGAIIRISTAVVNGGQGDLEVRALEASCGCTVVSEDALLVPAESSAEIGLEIDLDGETGSGVVSVSGIPSSLPNERVRVAQVAYLIDPECRGYAVVTEQPLLYLPGAEISVRCWVGGAGIELGVDAPICMDLPDGWIGRMVDAAPAVSDHRLGSGSGDSAIDLMVEIAGIAGPPEGVIVLEVPTDKEGVSIRIRVPIEFESGLVADGIVQSPAALLFGYWRRAATSGSIADAFGRAGYTWERHGVKLPRFEGHQRYGQYGRRGLCDPTTETYLHRRAES